MINGNYNYYFFFQLQAMGEITPHHIQQLQQLLPQMHTQTQQQNQYMWPPQAPQNPEPPQINSSGGKHNKQTFLSAMYLQ